MMGVAGSIRTQTPVAGDPDKAEITDLPWIEQTGDHR